MTPTEAYERIFKQLAKHANVCPNIAFVLGRVREGLGCPDKELDELEEDAFDYYYSYWSDKGVWANPPKIEDKSGN